MIEFGYDSFGKQWVPPSGGAPSGPTYDPTAQALFSRFTIEPTTARKDLINDRIIAGKASTWWAKLDAIWVHAAHGPEAARLNWLGDFYNCIPVNNPEFTVDRGYLGNGSSSYLDTQFNPASAVGAKFALASGSLGIRSNTNNTSNGSLAGFWSGSFGVTINPRDNSNNFGGRLNNGSGVNQPNASSSAVGMFVVNRQSAAAMSLHHHGVNVKTQNAGVAASVANGTFRLGSISNSSFRACEFSMGFIGGGMTDQEVTDIYNWFAVYRIAVGVA